MKYLPHFGHAMETAPSVLGVPSISLLSHHGQITFLLKLLFGIYYLLMPHCGFVDISSSPYDVSNLANEIGKNISGSKTPLIGDYLGKKVNSRSMSAFETPSRIPSSRNRISAAWIETLNVWKRSITQRAA